MNENLANNRGKNNSAKSVFLNPGEFFFGESPTTIKTLLGSCITITLWHPQRRIGGMCHFVLPEKSLYSATVTPHLDGRYCSGAMALFKQAVAKYHTRLSDYQAKIFGGSNMLARSTLSDDELIGQKNTEAAIEQLCAHNIALLLAHVGETGYRRIIFELKTGDVWVHHQKLEKIIPEH